VVGFKQTKETGDLIITESGRAFRFAKTAIGKGTLLRNIALVYVPGQPPMPAIGEWSSPFTNGLGHPRIRALVGGLGHSPMA
jgi:hypothetical protein